MDKIFWISLEQWSRLTPAEAKSLDDYCDQCGLELAVDVSGWHTDEIRAQDDFQKDKNEGRERFGGPGA